MRIRSAVSVVFLALVALASAPGCGVYNFIVKTTGIVSPPKLDTTGEIPPDFRLAISARDVTDPAVDYTYEFDRSGRATYDVTVRVPRRTRTQGEFEITEDRIVAMWRALRDVKFEDIEPRFPEEGDGTDRTQGVRALFAAAQGADHRVETNYQSNAEFQKVAAVVLASVPESIMKGDPGVSTSPVKEYIGDSTTHLFHRPNCLQLKDVPAQRRQPFGTAWDALNYYYQPCPECSPMPKSPK